MQEVTLGIVISIMSIGIAILAFYRTMNNIKVISIPEGKITEDAHFAQISLFNVGNINSYIFDVLLEIKKDQQTMKLVPQKMVTRSDGTGSSESMTHFPIEIMEMKPIIFLQEGSVKLQLMPNTQISGDLKFSYWGKRWKTSKLKKQVKSKSIKLQVTNNQFLFEFHA